MKMRVLLGSLLVVLFTAGSVHAAAVLRQIPFSRTTTLAVPAAYNFEFRLWTSANPADAAGVQVWAERKRITLKTKTVRQALGSVVPFDSVPVDFSQQLWVEVAVGKSGVYSPLPGARTRLNAQPYALHSEKAGALTGAIVLGESAGNWRTATTSSPTTFEILGPDALLGATGSPPPAANNTVAYSLPLTQPASVGGTDYRLASVEYCVRVVNANVKVDVAAIFSDNFTGSLPLTTEVSDPTDRTTVGCYTVSTSNGTARAYALVLSVAQVAGTTGGMIVSGVRSTWVPAAASGAAAMEALADDPQQLIPLEVMEQFAP